MSSCLFAVFGGERSHVSEVVKVNRLKRHLLCPLARRGKAIWIYASSLDSFEWLRTGLETHFDGARGQCCPRPTCAFVCMSWT